MRVLLKKDFTIEWLDSEKIINANDVGVATLSVETEVPLGANESLWVVFDINPDVVGDGVTNDILAKFSKVEGKDVYTIPIPSAIIKQAGRGITCYFQLFIKKSYYKKVEKEGGSEDEILDYITRASTETYAFEITGGLYYNESLNEIANNATIANLYNTAVEKIKQETTNAKDIEDLQTAIGTEADGENEATGIYAKIDAEASAREKADKNLDEKIATKASKISVSMNPTTYEATFGLYANAKDEPPIDTASIFLPIDTLVGGSYDKSSENIGLSLLSGKTISISMGELVGGLAPVVGGKIPANFIPDDLKINEDAIKNVLTSDSDKDWTDDEKANACDKIGAANEDDIDKALDEIIVLQEDFIKKGGTVVSGAKNIEDGEGNGAVQQVADNVADGFDFTGKNPNAEALDNTLSAIQPYGAKGDFAVALGGKSSAQGKRSTAEGTTTIAKGKYSHAEGDNSVTLGDDSHAEGYQTVAGEKSDGMHIAQHAEGIRTQALGWAAHSEGSDTIAKGNNSHAGGSHTIAEWNDQTAIGRYNDNKYGNLFEVGNGYVDENGKEVRRNAFEVDENGNAYAGGKRLLKVGEAAGGGGGGTTLYRHTIVASISPDTQNYHDVTLSFQSTVADSLIGAFDRNILKEMVERNEVYRFTGTTFEDEYGDIFVVQFVCVFSDILCLWCKLTNDMEDVIFFVGSVLDDEVEEL